MFEKITTTSNYENLDTKCATHGCHGRKFDDSDFCLACISQKSTTPLTRRCCDNLPCLADDIISSS